MTDELNKEKMMQDVEDILEHLTMVNKHLQKVYITLSEVIKEGTKGGNKDDEDGSEGL